MKGDEIVLLVVILMLIAFVSATVLTLLNGRQRLAEMKAKAALDAAAGADTERQNEVLRHEVGRLQQRIATLETIVTDPAERTAREIEQLR
ncbi:MAG TPA: hypothetical protein VGD66_14735 [Allosphingosinicella sp.]|jgi:hypothetical protein